MTMDRDAASVPPNRDALHPTLRLVHDYWRRMHPAAGLPGRQHLDPADIAAALPHVWLMEVHRDPLRLKYRLVGTAITEIAGRELTGQWLDEVHPGVTIFSDAVARLVHNAEPMWQRGKPTVMLAHKELIQVERLLLPLAADGRTVDMILACSAFYDSAGRSVT